MRQSTLIRLRAYNMKLSSRAARREPSRRHLDAAVTPSLTWRDGERDRRYHEIINACERVSEQYVGPMIISENHRAAAARLMAINGI